MPEPDREDFPRGPKREDKGLKRTLWVVYVLAFAGFSVFLGGILLAPYLRSRSSPLAGLVYTVYSPFCHQLAERSLGCFGHPFAVCSRCLGIYLGSFLGFLLFPFRGGIRSLRVPGKMVFLLLSAPILLDTAANFLGIWSSTDIVRLSTGLAWGVLLPFYLIAGIVDFLRQRRMKRGRLVKEST